MNSSLALKLIKMSVDRSENAPGRRRVKQGYASEIKFNWLVDYLANEKII